MQTTRAPAGVADGAVELVHVGFGNVLALNRVIAIVSPDAAPTKRLVHEGRARGMVVDLTNGRRTKAVLVLDNGYIALLALTLETLTGRLLAARDGAPLSARGAPQ
jgi:regulator of extracellular matrix RemA (YlzA/DUF370 family)